jgi:hypothetical protein
MPGLLNLWYEQMPYHKILPLEYDLSIKIFVSCSPLADFVLSLLKETVAGVLLNPPLDCSAPDSDSCRVR